MLALSLLLTLATPSAPACLGDEVPVTVVAHPPVEHLGPEIKAIAPALYERASAFTGAVACTPYTIELTADLARASHVLPAWHLPPWAAGAAKPEARHVLLTVHNQGRRVDRNRVLLHELSHLAVGAATGAGSVPRWFDEGVARLLAGEDGVNDTEVLAQARLGDKLLSLDELRRSFPAGSSRAAVAYAVSARAVAELLDSGGADVVGRLLEGVRHGLAFDDIMLKETGWTTGTLTREVHASVRPWHAWLTVLSRGDVFLALGGLVLAFGGIQARRRIRKAIAALDEDGPALPPLRPALWRWRTGPSPSHSW